MRWRWVGFGLAVGMVVAACGSSRPRFRDPKLGSANRSFEYSHNGQVLEATNGLRILLLPDDNTNLVRVDVRYRVGSVEDPKDRSGLAHVVEHMTFQLRPFGADGPSLFEKLGADALIFNAYTNWDETHYMSTALESHLQSLLEVEAHRLRSNCDQLSEADFAREREVVRQELAQRSGRGSELYATLATAFYGAGHPYARSVIGTDEELAAMTRDDVCEFFQRHHTPGSAILVVSGAIDVQKTIELINPLFGPIPKREAAPRTKIEPAVLGANETWHKLDVEEATAFIAFNIPAFTEDAAVFERMLRRMFAGWVHTLETKNDWITDVSFTSFGGVRAPLAVVAVSVKDSKRLEEAVKLVFDQRDEFLEDFSKPSAGSAVIQATHTAAMVNDQRAMIVGAVEPFGDRASVFADYLQYSDHTWFVIAALRALASVDVVKLRQMAPGYYERANSQVAYVIPGSGAHASAKRAQLQFSAQDYDLVDWDMPVDESESERDLAVPRRKRAGEAHSFTLGNGMRVVLQPNLAYPIVDARLVFPVGSLNDPEGKPGVAEVAAYMLRDDYDVELNRQQFENLKSVLRMGGDITADVDATATTFRIKGLANFADGLLWQLNWRVESGVYRKSSLKVLREFDEEDQTKAEKRNVRVHKYRAAVFGEDHPYAEAGATPEQLAAISTSDLKKFRDAHYRAPGATLIVTGKFDADDVERRIRRLFGKWSGGVAAEPVAVPPPAHRKRAMHFVYVDEDDPQVTVLFLRALRSGLAERGKREVMEALLNERMSSLRERLGATYGVSVSITSVEGPGTLAISASLDADRAGEAFTAMRKAMEELRTGDFTASFVRARRKALERVLAHSVDSSTVADELVFAAVYRLGDSYFDELAEDIATLRPNQLRPLLQDAVDPDRGVIVVRGPEAAVKAMFDAAGVKQYETLE